MIKVPYVKGVAGTIGCPEINPEEPLTLSPPFIALPGSYTLPGIIKVPP
jgi:hypothetical protein